MAGVLGKLNFLLSFGLALLLDNAINESVHYLAAGSQCPCIKKQSHVRSATTPLSAQMGSQVVATVLTRRRIPAHSSWKVRIA